MQDRAMFGAVHSPRAGIVWRGSFTEDGCYFLGPSWSPRGGGASAHVKNEEEEEEDGGEREREGEECGFENVRRRSGRPRSKRDARER